MVYIRVNTSRPFHFWNEESVALSNVWTLIDAHIEQKIHHMNNYKYKGEELTFSPNGDIIHSIYGKLGSNTSNIEAWKTLVRNFQASEKYPYLELLVREVWDNIPKPSLFEAEYQVDNSTRRLEIIDVSTPSNIGISLVTNSYSGLGVKVRTYKPFHFADEPSEEKDKLWALIDAHIEQESLKKEAREVRRTEARKQILISIKELLKDNPNLILKGEESWEEAEIEVQFNGKWIGLIEITDFAEVALPELYKQLM